MSSLLLKSGKNIKNLVVLDSGAVRNSGCEEFGKFFPDRYFVFGLGESNMISAAAGFAIAGKLPVVFGNARFLLSRAFDEIYNDICVPNLNVKIVGLGKSGVDESLVRVLPNMRFANVENLEGEIFSEYGPAYLK